MWHWSQHLALRLPPSPFTNGRKADKLNLKYFTLPFLPEEMGEMCLASCHSVQAEKAPYTSCQLNCCCIVFISKYCSKEIFSTINVVWKAHQFECKWLELKTSSEPIKESFLTTVNFYPLLVDHKSFPHKSGNLKWICLLFNRNAVFPIYNSLFLVADYSFV